MDDSFKSQFNITKFYINNLHAIEVLNKAKTQYNQMLLQLKFNQNHLSILVIVEYILSRFQHRPAMAEYIQRMPQGILITATRLVEKRIEIADLNTQISDSSFKQIEVNNFNLSYKNRSIKILTIQI